MKIVSLLLHFLGKPVLVTIPSPSCIHPVNVTWFVVLTVLSIEERGVEEGGGRRGVEEGGGGREEGGGGGRRGEGGGGWRRGEGGGGWRRGEGGGREGGVAARLLG